MNSAPALNQKELDRRLDAIRVCGANRGPHHYIPTTWLKTDTSEHVTHLMCRICFTRVSLKTLHEVGYEARIS